MTFRSPEVVKPRCGSVQVFVCICVQGFWATSKTAETLARSAPVLGALPGKHHAADAGKTFPTPTGSVTTAVFLYFSVHRLAAHGKTLIQWLL